MPRFARLFEAAEDILESFHEALRQRDLEAALRLWLDEDAVSCILPGGQRIAGHTSLREAFSQLLNKRAIWVDPIEMTTHATLGVSIFEVTEAVRFSANAVEADMYLHTTYILLQNHEGWRIAHMHSSSTTAADITTTPISATQALH